MKVPLQITMRNMKHSPAVKERIKEKADKLNQFSDKIISCQVVIEQEQSHRQNGAVHTVRLHLTIPGKDLIVNRNHEENLYLAITQAFDDMVRQLEETSRIMQGDIKHHPPVIHGEIARLFGQDQFGFILSSTGDEYYFNADNLVKQRFDNLKVGMPVQFIEKIGDEGLKACRVSVHSHTFNGGGG